MRRRRPETRTMVIYWKFQRIYDGLPLKAEMYLRRNPMEMYGLPWKFFELKDWNQRRSGSILREVAICADHLVYLLLIERNRRAQGTSSESGCTLNQLQKLWIVTTYWRCQIMELIKGSRDSKRRRYLMGIKHSKLKMRGYKW